MVLNSCERESSCHANSCERDSSWERERDREEALVEEEVGGVAGEGDERRSTARRIRRRAPMVVTPSCSARCCSVSNGSTSMLISSRRKCGEYCPMPMLSNQVAMFAEELEEVEEATLVWAGGWGATRWSLCPRPLAPAP